MDGHLSATTKKAMIQAMMEYMDHVINEMSEDFYTAMGSIGAFQHHNLRLNSDPIPQYSED